MGLLPFEVHYEVHYEVDFELYFESTDVRSTSDVMSSTCQGEP
ncbi:hypothetical protein U9R90_22255 [Streptomyces sp. E11-3]